MLRVTDDDGAPAALKVAPGLAGAFDTLSAYAAAGAGPELLAWCRDVDAVLLAWVDGPDLETVPDLPAGVAATVALTGRMHGMHPVPRLVGLSDRMAAEAGVAAGWLRRSGADPGYDPGLLARPAPAWSAPSGLLHGDLHTRNVIWSAGGPQLIDPDPVAGPLERDVATLCLRVSPDRPWDEVLGWAAAGWPDVDLDLVSVFAAHWARYFLAHRTVHGSLPSGELAARVLAVASLDG